MTTRNGRSGTPQQPQQPRDEEVARPAGASRARVTGTDPDQPLTIHRPGTFPESGRNVAFRLSEGETLTGRFRARLSWDVNASPTDIVIHLSAFLVDDDSKVPVGNPYYCVHHDNDRSKDGSTLRKGRRQHGRHVRDETITVELDYVDEDVEKIALVAYIQDATPLKHTFKGLVDGKVTFHQVSTDDPEEEESPLDIEPHLVDGDYYEKETAVVLGELFRRSNGAWGYRDIGRGRSGLAEVGQEYGVVFVSG